MKVTEVTKRDLNKINKNVFKILIALGICVIPVIYGFTYLAGSWDPYNNLDKMKVAVVNEDSGYIREDKKYNLGEELVDKLNEDKNLDWQFVSLEEANKGMEDKKYYAMIQIPKNFSEDMFTPIDSKEIKEPVIYFTSNKKKGYISNKTVDVAMDTVQKNLNESVSLKATAKVVDKVYDTKNKLIKAVDGSKELNKGIEGLNEGVKKIKDGTELLTGKVPEVKEGVENLYNGVVLIDDNIAMLNEKFKDVEKMLNENVNSIDKASLDKLVNDAYQLENSLSQIDMEKINNALSNPLIQKVLNSPEELQGEISGLNNKIDKILAITNSSQFANTMQTLSLVGEKLNQIQSSGVLDQTAAIANNKDGLLKLIGTLQAKGAITEEQGKLLMGSVMVTSKVNDEAANLDAILKTINGLNIKPEDIQNINDTLVNAKGSLNAIAPMLSPENMSNLASMQALIPQVNEIKSDIQKNQGNIQVAKQAISQGKKYLDLLPSFSQKLDMFSAGSNKLRTGVESMYNKIPSAIENVNKLSGGTAELYNGSTKIKDGSKKLATELENGVKDSDKVLIHNSDELSKFMEEPTKVEKTFLGNVDTYGEGLAPYLIPLSLWVGALVTFFLIKEKVDEDLKDTNKVSIVLGKFMSYSIIGIVQSVILSTMLLVLGIKPDNIVLYYGLNILLSLVSMAALQFLIFTFGDAGKLLGIAALVIQLVTCSGTFAVETLPKVFSVINPFVPFTYAVDALREVLAGPNMGIVAHDCIILIGFLVGFILLTIVFKDKLSKKVKDGFEDALMN
ncbi:MAG: YhgE/Pip domain-containing protein [Clostridium argentinense]|uniref:YhgE/Pip domain-containing protein n=1 Tax=Clostridium faecium TaxID=2762223 RepID=A0ABR8YNS0_9CLOT|nr:MULTISPECIES: YhgE/Pip domain-containing protein [Clostridium]MBD8045898.1 YhgE/Pip domain-containing protein [Clostridium faecium]MBS5825114.1 YhgE/Pip domain-containing protein [Clostridium argentinense]MDU1350218.1 YhgE/Pip domain-containing protein [Clostridium argentinense]